MDRFHADVLPLDLGARVALWHRGTGRHFAMARELLTDLQRWSPALPPPPALAAVARRLNELHLLAESPAPAYATLIPARSRLPLLLPDLPALWLPAPTHRTAGGHGWAELSLRPTELRLWRSVNGARTCAAVAAHADVPLDDALRFFRRLTAPEVQALQLRATPPHARDLGLTRLVAPARPPHARAAHVLAADGGTDLERFHLHDITDGEHHFDNVETTVAHAFALPHAALGGVAYGARLYQALTDRGLMPEDGRTLEIGPGDGELGADWLRVANAAGRPTGEHIRLDQSPELLATQRRRQPNTTELLGCATRIPLPDASVALAICNEVIADLSAVPYDPDEMGAEGRVAQVAERLNRYGLRPLPGRALYNLGAWKLIEELARILEPGGAACLTEFGGLDETPTETEQLDHPEVSIHFGFLVEIARSLGLRATCLPLPELLEMDPSAQWLWRGSYHALRARMRMHGLHLQARAWTPDTLRLPWPVEGLRWVPVTDEGPGPLPTRFMALLVQRPPDPAR